MGAGFLGGRWGGRKGGDKVGEWRGGSTCGGGGLITAHTVHGLLEKVSYICSTYFIFLFNKIDLILKKKMKIIQLSTISCTLSFYFLRQARKVGAAIL